MKEQKMTKRQESSADRIWKERLEECCSAGDAVALLVVVVLCCLLVLIA
jgi:hypothetical protein